MHTAFPFRPVLFALALIVLTAANATAQQASTPAPAADPMGSLLEVMKDDALRNQLIRELEAARAQTPPVTETPASPAAETSPATTTPPSDAPRSAEASAEEEVMEGGGLASGLMEWLHEMGTRLPSAALGAPIDQKIRMAEIQIERRLSETGAADGIRALWSQWLPGWAVASMLALLVSAFVRRRIQAPVPHNATTGYVAREAALRTGLGLLPILACVATLIGWTLALGFADQQSVIFLALATPFVIMVAVSGLSSALLLLLAPAKGWRLVSYAQRQLSPLVGVLLGVATAAAIMAIPELRAAIGPATADLARLFFDLCVPLVALWIIMRERRIVRSLIVRGHTPDESNTSLDRAIYSVGENWHRIGFAFVVLNILARLFGTQTGSFLSQSFFSVALIVLALILSSTLRRASEEKSGSAVRIRKRSMRSAIFRRFRSVLVGLLQLLIAIAALIVCFSLWGVDLVAWAGSRAGSSIVRPLTAIGVLVVTAWTLWVILDAWITELLSPVDAVNGRQRSARVKTLLPLLRNFAFIALCVLTVMGVLSNLGINIAPLIAGAGVVGLAIGFGSQQLVQDVITGLFILLEDTIAIGDNISTGDRTGTVEALTIRTVKIRDADGSLHSIPFSTIKALKNSSRGFGVYTAAVTLDTEADVEQALAVLREAGNAVRSDPAFRSKILGPFEISGIDQIGLDGVVVKGSIKTHPLQQAVVGNEVNRRIYEALHQAGIPLARRNGAPIPVSATST